MDERDTEISAETEYLFRHATVRDAAYQLLPMSQRARLHVLALDILEESTLGMNLDSVNELAEHARLAQVGVTFAGSELPIRELRYIRLAATNAASKYDNEVSCRLWERVADHASASAGERMEALTEAGVLYWMLGRRESALRCLTGAIDSSTTDSQRLAYCLIERGTLYRDIREYQNASADLARALELARQSGNKHLELRALGNLCTVQDSHMTQTGVKELYEPVLKLAREIGDDRAIGITEGQIGLACMRGDDFAGAERHLMESIEKLRAAGDKLNEGAMTSSLGTLFERRTDGDRRLNLMRAVQYHRDGLAIKEHLGFLFQKAAPLCGLASSHRLMGMLPEAEKYARQALQLSLEIGDPANIGAAYFELGAVQEARGEPVQAERTFSYGFLAIEESQAEAAKIKLLGALARLMAGQGDWEDAENHAHNAVQLASRVKDTRTRTRTRQLLRSIESRQKPTEDIDADFD
ncbi:MAG: hypothetical protein KDB82_10620 [Planctomycetes bacterium]|nr:hypothetical protein [Planctomycetota bacterium]